MSKERLTEDIKIRVPPAVKATIARVADGRHLAISDIVREALREYVDRNGANGEVASTKPEISQPA